MTNINSNSTRPVGTIDDELLTLLQGTEHHAMYAAMLSDLDRFETPMAIKTEEDYARAYSVKSALCSLSCHTVNNNLPQNDRVWLLESVWGKALKKYNDRHLLKDSDDVFVANYLLAKRYYTAIDRNALLALAKMRGFLRQINGSLVVVGLSKKVGDNTFTIDRHGRHHRNFIRTIGRQYFRLSMQDVILDESFFNDIPHVEDNFRETYLGDGKGLSKYPSIASDTYYRLCEILQKFATNAEQVAT